MTQTDNPTPDSPEVQEMCAEVETFLDAEEPEPNNSTEEQIAQILGEQEIFFHDCVVSAQNFDMDALKYCAEINIEGQIFVAPVAAKDPVMLAAKWFMGVLQSVEDLESPEGRYEAVENLLICAPTLPEKVADTLDFREYCKFLSEAYACFVEWSEPDEGNPYPLLAPADDEFRAAARKQIILALFHGQFDLLVQEAAQNNDPALFQALREFAQLKHDDLEPVQPPSPEEAEVN